MIPFKYGTVVSGEDFCDRRGAIKQLSEILRSHQNVLLQGERRIGKTSLIFETTRRIMSCKTLLIDTMEIKTSHDLCQRIIRAFISLESNSTLLSKILKYFASLRPKLGVDSITGLPVVTLDQSVQLKPDALEGILDLIASIQNKNLIIVFDEFQDILNIREPKTTLAVLRSKIQYHDHIAYVFAGSIRNKMEQIFTHPESPLFKAAIPITVGPIPKKDFTVFLRKKFLIGKRTISDEALDRIFDLADLVTGDIQQLCEALWSVTSYGGRITPKDLKKAFELIFSRESKSYEIILNDLTALQLRCLDALARFGGKAPTSARFLKESGIRQPSSVSKALTKLMNRKIIFAKDKAYRFVNPFFKAWLIAKGF